MQPDTAFLKQRADQLYRAEAVASYRQKHRMFAVLLVLQWLAGIALAAWYSPNNGIGRVTSLSIELGTAVGLGGLIVAVPLFLIFRQPNAAITRHAVGIGQMLASALLIHLSGGRLEMRFLIFGSLAFLAFYRDWRVLASASAVVALDQFARGFFWPQSLFGAAAGTGGTALSAHWRWLEFTLWVFFEDIFLIYACLQRDRELHALCERQAQVEDTQGSVERTVSERTAQLSQSNRELNRQINERQRVEQEMRAAREQMEGKVRERTGELGAANRALQRYIEEGRKTQEELARSIQRYRFVTDSVPQIVWTAQPDGAIDYFNRRFHEYTGMTTEESRDWGWKPVIHPDDLSRCLEAWNYSVQTGEVYEMELRYRRGVDGAYRWHLSRAMPMRDPEGNIIQWFGASTDIDDQKRSREAIKRSEQRYRSLVA